MADSAEAEMDDLKRKAIGVTEHAGIFRVSAEFENGFHLVPTPTGRISMAFWDEQRMKVFLDQFGYAPVIRHGTN
jgi:hypothetical protein